MYLFMAVRVFSQNYTKNPNKQKARLIAGFFKFQSSLYYLPK